MCRLCGLNKDSASASSGRSQSQRSSSNIPGTPTSNFFGNPMADIMSWQNFLPQKALSQLFIVLASNPGASTFWSTEQAKHKCCNSLHKAPE